MPELVVLNGIAKGTVFVLGDVPAVVGRSPEAHLRIGDPWISSMHAMFERRDDGLWVVDLESRNGVFVRGERVAEAHVSEGAVVRLGRTEIQLAAGRPRTDEVPAVAEDVEAPPPRRETARSENTGPSPAVQRPTGGARDRPHLVHGDATVLRMAVDAVGLEPSAGSAKVLRDALDAAASAAATAGAAVARLAGVGVLAVFGLDGPAPEDAQRALVAARAARAAVRDARGLDLRAGLESGPVVAGRATPHGDLAVLGQAAERAERLAALARPGEILVGAGAANGRRLLRIGEVRLGDLELEVFRDEGA